MRSQRFHLARYAGDGAVHGPRWDVYRVASWLLCALLLALAAVLLCGPASAGEATGSGDTKAAWTTAARITLVCNASGSQTSPLPVSDDAGGAVIAWIDERDNGAGIYAHHVLATGDVDPAWPAQGLQLCAALGHISNLAIARDGAGGAFVAWQDDRTGFPNVYAQHALHSGMPDAAWPADGIALSNSFGDRRNPAIDFDGQSGAVVAWEEIQDGQGVSILAQHISSGLVDWGPNGVAVSAGDGTRLRPMLVTDYQGGAIIVFLDSTFVSPLILAQHVRQSGDLDPAWPETGLGLAGMGLWGAGTFALSDDAGGAFVVDGHDSGVLAMALTYQHVLASGTIAAQGTIGGTNPHRGMYEPAVGPDGMGFLTAAWLETWYENAPWPDPFIWHHQLHVTPRPSVPGATYDGMDVFHPVVVGDGAGGTIVAFLTNDMPGPGNLLVGHVRATGLADPACPPGGKWISGMPAAPHLVSNRSGGALLVWQVHDDATEWDIAATLLAGPLPTDALASLVSVNATSDRVRLEWALGRAAAPLVTVYRRTSESAWWARAAATPDAAGRVVVVDDQVASGMRYGYRLGLALNEVERFAGETWVDVPAALAFALHGTRPNPGAGDPIVAFSLATARPATLELLDVSGRRIASREVGSLGAGSHVVKLTSGRVIASGVYVLRLTQDGRTLTDKAVLMK